MWHKVSVILGMLVITFGGSSMFQTIQAPSFVSHLFPSSQGTPTKKLEDKFEQLLRSVNEIRKSVEEGLKEVREEMSQSVHESELLKQTVSNMHKEMGALVDATGEMKQAVSCMESEFETMVNKSEELKQTVSGMHKQVQTMAQICPEPEVEGGTVTNSTGLYVGATAEYTCLDVEHTLSGRKGVTTCQVSGNWDEADGGCLPTEWENPTGTVNIEPYVKKGSTITALFELTERMRSHMDLIRGNDVLFHTSIRRDEKSVVRTARFNGKWGRDERSYPYFSFRPGKQYNYTLTLTEKEYKAYMDGEYVFEFKHRKRGLPQMVSFWDDMIVNKLILN